MGQWVSAVKEPILSAADEAVTLVVGNDREYKLRVARAIAEARGATVEEVSKAGVRIFFRELAPAAPVVVDAVPLSNVKDLEPVDTARRWVSQNSLRRLCGKLVFVVCVIATDAEDENYGELDPESKRFGWLHLLGCIFEQAHRQKIVILVNSEDSAESTDEALKRQPQLTAILKRDGFRDNTPTVFNFEGEALTPAIESIVQHIASRGEANDKTKVGNRNVMTGPFLLREVGRNASDTLRFGPWGPENIILFGKTGSGKSTLAQMLTSARLDPLHKKMSVSSSIRGLTSKVRYAQGRGWRVIDTPGLGESVTDAKTTVSTAKAERLIRKYVMLQEGIFSHFIYVWKKGRIDKLDENLWEVFVRMFGAEMIRTHMSVVVSDADQDWLDRNVRDLEVSFKGCESFMTAEFPNPAEQEDDQETQETQEVRLDSLRALEDDLASLRRTDASCRLGKWSMGTERSFNIRSADDAITMRPSIRETPAFGSAVGTAQPSDYETARARIRWRSLIATIVEKACVARTNERHEKLS